MNHANFFDRGARHRPWNVGMRRLIWWTGVRAVLQAVRSSRRKRRSDELERDARISRTANGT
jgi:hypothetical protein